MNKEVIYIDAEDDITAIISKIKAASKSIVAVVPPRQAGVLQSAVNLRLIDRAAKREDKTLVVVSSDRALSALAASAKIPIAKNLQSKPEIPEISALDVNDGEEVIDGSTLAVGALAAAAIPKDVRDSAVDAVELEDAEASHEAVTQRSVPRPATAKPTKAGKTPKVPNYASFRKKLVLFGLLGVVIAGVLVWALVFAPRAVIAITARTSDADISQQVTLAPDSTTSADASQLQATVETGSQKMNQTFQASGSRNVGAPATGNVTFSNSSFQSVTVAAGTTLTSNSGNSYTVNASVVVPNGSCQNIFACNAGSASGAVTAAAAGTASNGDSGNLSGAPDGVSATFSAPTSGGTDKIEPVVTANDITKAMANVKNSFDDNQALGSLESQLGSGYIVLEASFKADLSGLQSTIPSGTAVTSGQTPAIGGSVKYQVYAVSKNTLKTYLTSALESQFSNPDNEKVYDTGIDSASFSNVTVNNSDVTATLTATGKVGPKIDSAAIIQAARGEKEGQVQSQVENINGVEGVSVNFSPFWVDKVPNNPAYTSVQFKVQ